MTGCEVVANNSLQMQDINLVTPESRPSQLPDILYLLSNVPPTYYNLLLYCCIHLKGDIVIFLKYAGCCKFEFVGIPQGTINGPFRYLTIMIDSISDQEIRTCFVAVIDNFLVWFLFW